MEHLEVYLKLRRTKIEIGEAVVILGAINH